MSVIEFTAESAGQRNLPDGWRWVQLGKAARVFAGSAAPQGEDYFDPQGPPFVRVSDLGQKGRTSFLVDIRDRLSPKALRECSLVLAKKGTVLFPKSGAAISTNSRAVLGIDAYIVSHLMAIEATEQTTPDWLYWSLCQLDMMDYSDNVGYPSLKQSTVEKVTIPLPPLSEQKRIAAILNEQMAAVERARAAAEAQLEAAELLLSAYLSAVLEESQSNHMWTSSKIGELADAVRGSSPRPKDDPRYYGGKVPRLMVADVTRDGMYVTPKIDFLTDEGAKLSRPMKKGDIVMVVSGDPGLPGILAVDACIHDGFVGFRNLKEGVLRSDFFFWFLKFKKVATDSQAAGAIFRNLTTDQIKEISIDYPPIPEQERICTFLSQKMVSIEITCKALKDQLDTINKLPAALLHRAFNGLL